MSTIDPADVAVVFPHGLGRLLVFKAARHCPFCRMPMMVWLDTGTAAACVGCLEAAEPRPAPKHIEPQRNTPERT